MMVVSNISRWHWMNQAGEEGWFTRGTLEISSDWGKSTEKLYCSPRYHPASGDGGCKSGSQIKRSLMGLITQTNARNNLAWATICSGDPQGWKTPLNPGHNYSAPALHEEHGVLCCFPFPKPDMKSHLLRRQPQYQDVLSETCCQPRCTLLCDPHAAH